MSTAPPAPPKPLAEAIDDFLASARAMRAARIQLEQAAIAGGVDAFPTLTTTAALETLSSTQGIVLAELMHLSGPYQPSARPPGSPPLGSLNVLGAALAQVSDVERHRLNVAFARGQARVSSDCTCGTCASCYQSSDYREGGQDPEAAFYAEIMGKLEPSRLVIPGRGGRGKGLLQ